MEVRQLVNQQKAQGRDPSDALFASLAPLVFDGPALQAGQSRLPLLAVVQDLPEPVRAHVFNSLTQAVRCSAVLRDVCLVELPA